MWHHCSPQFVALNLLYNREFLFMDYIRVCLRICDSHLYANQIDQIRVWLDCGQCFQL